jgi:hypothetical protein
MAFYATNQASIPVLTGGVIPDYVASLDDYRQRIFGCIYAALDQVPGTGLIRHEWVNSRGAIMRFDREAMEVRVLDLQECPKMDVAIAAFVRGALAAMSARIRAGELDLPDRRLLLADYRNAVIKGRDAAVTTTLFRGGRRLRSARALLERLLDEASGFLGEREPGPAGAPTRSQTPTESSPSVSKPTRRGPAKPPPRTHNLGVTRRSFLAMVRADVHPTR